MRDYREIFEFVDSVGGYGSRAMAASGGWMLINQFSDGFVSATMWLRQDSFSCDTVLRTTRRRSPPVMLVAYTSKVLAYSACGA